MTGSLYAQISVPVKKSNEIREVDGNSYYIHEVKKGQTLYSISKAYEISIDEIVFENPGADKELQIDQILKIPLISREEKVLESLRDDNYDFFYHVSREGETFKEIGKIYEISENNIRKVNTDLKEPLKAGEYVKIPVSGKTMVSKQESKPDKDSGSDESPKSKKYFNHVVKKKETLYRISQLYNVSINDLKKLNPGLTEDLDIGQLIRIPDKSTASHEEETAEEKEKKKFAEHEVKRGENLYRIALRYKISIDTLKRYNPGLSEHLIIGQIIMIPADTVKKNYILHKVEQRKDKLRKIAKKYDLDYYELREANPQKGNRVYRNQLIRIPVVYPDTTMIAFDTLYDEIPEKIEEVDRDTIDLIKILDKNIKETYDVALMLPLYLNEFDSLLVREISNTEDIINKNPFRFIQFYEGFLIAADSLEQKGLKLKIHTYDVNQNISNTIRVLQEPELSKADLIIGPFYSKSFELAANFAKLYDINIVNPLTRREEILHRNPYVFKVQPSTQKQIEQVAELVLTHFPYSKIILVRDNRYQNSLAVERFREIFEDSIVPAVPIPNYVLNNILEEKIDIESKRIQENDEEKELIASFQVEEQLIFKEQVNEFLEDTTMFRNYISEVVYTSDSIQGILNNASVVRDNVIITISDDKVFIIDFLTKLNVLRDTFSINVLGIPEWADYSDFAPQLFQNLNVHLFSSKYIDYKDKDIIDYIEKFRLKYHTEPDKYAFDGFDIGYFFLNALMKFGNDFPRYLNYHEPRLLQSRYVFRKRTQEDGYENIYWNIYKYDNYKMKTIPNYWFYKNRLKEKYFVNDMFRFSY